MSAGRGTVSVHLTLHNLYTTLIFIDVCIGEGRTASWKEVMK